MLAITRLWCSPVLATALVLAACPAFSHQGASGIVLERMQAMEDTGDAVKAVKAMADGKQPFDIAKVEALGERIAAHAVDIPGLFPDRHDSRKGAKTRALPAIWDDWEEFQALAGKMEQAARALGAVAAADGPEGAKAQLRDLGLSCRGCHDQFRSKRK